MPRSLGATGGCKHRTLARPHTTRLRPVQCLWSWTDRNVCGPVHQRSPVPAVVDVQSKSITRAIGHAQDYSCPSPCASLYVRTRRSAAWIDVCVHLRTHSTPRSTPTRPWNPATLHVTLSHRLSPFFTKFVVPPHGSTTAKLW